MKQVKITGCSKPFSWYEGLEGRHFRVIDWSDVAYALQAPAEGRQEDWQILKQDAEEVTEMNYGGNPLIPREVSPNRKVRALVGGVIEVIHED
jgi:hypothetical protein